MAGHTGLGQFVEIETDDFSVALLRRLRQPAGRPVEGLVQLLERGWQSLMQLFPLCVC